MRVFIVYDDLGNVVSAGQFEELHEKIEQPFLINNPKHAVVELDSNDENYKALVADKSEGKAKSLLKIHSEFKVDKKTKKLLKREGLDTPIDKAPTEPKPPATPKPPTGKPNQPGETPPTRNPGDVSEK